MERCEEAVLRLTTQRKIKKEIQLENIWTLNRDANFTTQFKNMHININLRGNFPQQIQHSKEVRIVFGHSFFSFNVTKRKIHFCQSKPPVSGGLQLHDGTRWWQHSPGNAETELFECVSYQAPFILSTNHINPFGVKNNLSD